MGWVTHEGLGPRATVQRDGSRLICVMGIPIVWVSLVNDLLTARQRFWSQDAQNQYDLNCCLHVRPHLWVKQTVPTYVSKTLRENVVHHTESACAGKAQAPRSQTCKAVPRHALLVTPDGRHSHKVPSVPCPGHDATQGSPSRHPVVDRPSATPRHSAGIASSCHLGLI